MAQHAKDDVLDDDVNNGESVNKVKSKKVKEEYDWFEDPFDDEKTEAELNAARHSQRRSFIIVLIVFIVIVFIAVLFIGGCAVLSSMSDTTIDYWV